MVLYYSVLYTVVCYFVLFFFFFNDTATTEIYTLSLHDALPISLRRDPRAAARGTETDRAPQRITPVHQDRKSTRLNSSHSQISYAVFCLKKKKKKQTKNIKYKRNETVQQRRDKEEHQPQ